MIANIWGGACFITLKIFFLNISFKYVLKSGFQRSRVFNGLVKICETSNHYIVRVFHLNIAHIEDYCDVIAFWHNDQYITYLLLTCIF